MSHPYRVSVLDAAERELVHLDKSVAQRIVKRVEWLALNLEEINPEALKGSFADLFKLRVGDYRVIYAILDNEHRIIIHSVGYRREIYR
jgi:mRNA interferase RelE/StbE